MEKRRKHAPVKIRGPYTARYEKKTHTPVVVIDRIVQSTANGRNRHVFYYFRRILIFNL